MASHSTNPFVWDRPFAFVWLSSDEGHPTQHTLEQHIVDLARNADFKSELPKGEETPIESIMSFPFMPHVTLHTVKLDEKDVEGSLERMISKTVEWSETVGKSGVDLKVKMSEPLKGVTHFKSVYMEVEKGSEGEKELKKAKEEAVKVFGRNEPEEKEYQPHLSLWYGKDERVRGLTHGEAKKGPVGEGVETMDLSHVHLVYAPKEDVRSWKLVGSTRVGSDVFFRRRAYIDGKWEYLREVDLATSKRAHQDHQDRVQIHHRLPIVNPATGENMGYMEGCGKDEAERAIQAAHRAIKTWSRDLGLKERIQIIRRMVSIIKERSSYLSRLETTDNGKPLREAEADVNDTADCFEYYCSLAENDPRLNLAISSPDASSSSSSSSSFGIKVPLSEASSSQIECSVMYEPVGVSVMILPFNYPLLMAAWKLGPALVSGCTVIVKPSEETSATALELAAIAQEAGVPRGVINILPSLGPAVGPTLCQHPLVRKIAFTGSGNTGKHIMRESTKHLPNVSLELGGKSPAIVFPDANLDAAYDWLLMGIFFNAGQVCSATSRLLIHSSIYDKVKEKLKQSALSLQSDGRMGDPRLPNTLLGPLVSLSQYNRVRRLVEDGVAQGAKFVTGKINFESSSVQRPGFFFSPTILENVHDDNILWRTEVFGPVLVLRKFDTEEEAIALANDSPFGLAAAVFSQDPALLHRCARNLHSGIVWLNCSQPTLIQAPWGGFKESGVGRELGPWGLDNFLEPKQITSWIAKDNYGWYSQL